MVSGPTAKRQPTSVSIALTVSFARASSALCASCLYMSFSGYYAVSTVDLSWLPYTIGEYLADAFPFALRTARRLPADHKCTPFRDRTEAGPRERLSKPHANSNFLASDHIS